MISFLNGASSGPPARYLIAQYVPDMFRREPRNVGIVLEKAGCVVCKFIGETESGWDPKKLRWANNPNAYRLWVDHWRKQLDKYVAAWPSERLESDGATFALIPGGELLETGSDTPQEVCEYLYRLLVSTGGLADALSPTAQEELQLALKEDLVSEFRQQGLMASNMFVSNPIQANYSIRGASYWHQVTFYQETPRQAWAMEPVDFTSRFKNWSRDHAAYMKYVFDDLRLEKPLGNQRPVETIAIIRLEPGDSEHTAVSKGLEMLEGNCRIVNWVVESERDDFIQERLEAANAA